MISIIIPCSDEYRVKFLPECLASVEPQLGNNELIIEKFVPGTDDGADIFNRGVKKSRGDFCLVLGADDKLADGALRTLEAAIDESDVYYGNIEEFGDVSRVYVPPKKVGFEDFLKQNEIAITSLFRKSKYEQIGGYWKSAECPEDWEFWARMAKYGAKFKYVAATILRYRVHRAQAWTAMQHNKEKYRKIINDRLKYDFIQKME